MLRDGSPHFFAQLPPLGAPCVERTAPCAIRLADASPTLSIHQIFSALPVLLLLVAKHFNNVSLVMCEWSLIPGDHVTTMLPEPWVAGHPSRRWSAGSPSILFAVDLFDWFVREKEKKILGWQSQNKIKRPRAFRVYSLRSVLCQF